MPTPIRVEWHNRPGWGEYGAWRKHGSHDGFDSYTLPKATIYGTADGGKVIGKGHVADGWGYYIDVWYPATPFRKQYVQRDCHMNEASGLPVGASVNSNTALGRVGQTGNAKGIVWVRNGVALWHVHSEVYLNSATFNTTKRVDPLTIWGATTAGGGTRIEEGGPLMALSDAEQTELLNKTRAVYDALFKNEPITLPGRSTLPGGVLVNQSIVRDALFQETGAAGASRDGVFAFMRKLAEKLGLPS